MPTSAELNLRRGVLALVVLGTAGMCVELAALEHYGTGDQLIPLALGAAALIISAWVAAAPGLVSIRFLQFVMLLYIGAGIVGMTLHRDAGIARVLEDGETAVIPPLLSPAVLVHLGLLGLLYTYRHPAVGDDDTLR